MNRLALILIPVLALSACSRAEKRNSGRILMSFGRVQSAVTAPMEARLTVVQNGEQVSQASSGFQIDSANPDQEIVVEFGFENVLVGLVAEFTIELRWTGAAAPRLMYKVVGYRTLEQEIENLSFPDPIFTDSEERPDTDGDKATDLIELLYNTDMDSSADYPPVTLLIESPTAADCNGWPNSTPLHVKGSATSAAGQALTLDWYLAGAQGNLELLGQQEGYFTDLQNAEVTLTRPLTVVASSNGFAVASRTMLIYFCPGSCFDECVAEYAAACNLISLVPCCPGFVCELDSVPACKRCDEPGASCDTNATCCYGLSCVKEAGAGPDEGVCRHQGECLSCYRHESYSSPANGSYCEVNATDTFTCQQICKARGEECEQDSDCCQWIESPQYCMVAPRQGTQKRCWSECGVPPGNDGFCLPGTICDPGAVDGLVTGICKPE